MSVQDRTLRDCARISELMRVCPLSATAHSKATTLVVNVHRRLERHPEVTLHSKSRVELLRACFNTFSDSTSTFADEVAEDLRRTQHMMFLLMYTNRDQSVDTLSWSRALAQLRGSWLPPPLRDVSTAMESVDDTSKDNVEAEDGHKRNEFDPSECETLTLQQRCEAVGLGTLCSECNGPLLEKLGRLFLVYARDSVAEAALTRVAPAERSPFTETEVYNRTKAVATQACSELGQNALKDLILSFRMPRSAVGVRRTLMLPRETSTIATKQHSNLVHIAHQAAMLTSETVWLDTEYDDTSRICAMLSGLAMFYAADAVDVRDNEAFHGIVELPFIQASVSRTAMRIKLVERTWYCYEGPTGGPLCVYSKGVGVDGLVDALMHLTTHVKPQANTQ